jgi:hypothetical protein
MEWFNILSYLLFSKFISEKWRERKMAIETTKWQNFWGGVRANWVCKRDHNYYNETWSTAPWKGEEKVLGPAGS